MRLSDLVSQQECLVTRVWGFSPENWGAMGFPVAGTTDKWLDRNQNLRVVCFVSHHAAEYINEADRGRVLGIYELEPQQVSLIEDDVIAPEHFDNAALHHADGRFRWPTGLRAVRAWKFQPVAPRTRETLPDARSWGFDVSTNLVPISARDYELLDQLAYNLTEVPVYGIPFDASRVAAPVAIPSFVYMFATAREDMLRRLPGWARGEILVKIGCTSDLDGRLNSFNEHPLARIIGLKLGRAAKRYVGEEAARAEEDRLLALAAKIGRPAADESTEFYFVSDQAYHELLKQFTPAIRVA